MHVMPRSSCRTLGAAAELGRHMAIRRSPLQLSSSLEMVGCVLGDPSMMAMIKER